MTRFDKSDERAQQRWFQRSVGKPLVLAASVEETMKKNSVQEHREPHEATNSEPVSEDRALIPPLLSLPSKLFSLLPFHPRRGAWPSPKQPEHRRTTKVRLQGIPERAELPCTEELSTPPLYEVHTHPSLPAMERFGEQPLRTIHKANKDVSGAGIFERGQDEVAVANRHVTISSVVVVILTGNPGPVVLHYISLQPGKGFTLHLSAPTQQITPFNYILL